MTNRLINWPLLSQLSEKITAIEKGKVKLERCTKLLQMRILELRQKDSGLTPKEQAELDDLERLMASAIQFQEIIAKTEELISLTKTQNGIGEALRIIKEIGSPN